MKKTAKVMGIGKVKNALASEKSKMNFSKFMNLNDVVRLYFLVTKTDPDDADDVASWTIPSGIEDFATMSTIENGKEITSNVRVSTDNDRKMLKPYINASKILHVAAFNKAWYAKDRDIKEEIERGSKVTDASIEKKRKEVETLYFGNNTDKENIVFAKYKPILQNVRGFGTTMCVALKVTVDGPSGRVEPADKTDVPTVIQYPLSDPKIDALVYALSTDGVFTADDFHRLPNGQYWMEVSLTYRGKDKSAAGRSNAVVGCIVNATTKETNPALFEQIQTKLTSIPIDSDLIMAQNSRSKYAISVKEAISKFHSYVADKVVDLTYLPEDDQSIEYYGSSVLSLGILDESPKIKAKFEELVPTVESDKEESKELDEEAEEEYNSVTEDTEESMTPKKGKKIAKEIAAEKDLDDIDDIDEI